MTRSLAVSLSLFAVFAFCGVGSLPMPARAQERPAAPDRPIDKLTVARPSWHRGAGLLFGEVTVKNANAYALVNVIITCDFFDQWGNPIGRKGTALRRPVPPGKTRFSGIEFSITTPNMQAGACRPLSAERLTNNSTSQF